MKKIVLLGSAILTLVLAVSLYNGAGAAVGEATTEPDKPQNFHINPDGSQEFHSKRDELIDLRSQGFILEDTPRCVKDLYVMEDGRALLQMQCFAYFLPQ